MNPSGSSRLPAFAAHIGSDHFDLGDHLDVTCPTVHPLLKQALTTMLDDEDLSALPEAQRQLASCFVTEVLPILMVNLNAACPRVNRSDLWIDVDPSDMPHIDAFEDEALRVGVEQAGPEIFDQGWHINSVDLYRILRFITEATLYADYGVYKAFNPQEGT